MPNISRILVPVDFSASSEEALSFALYLAGNLGASVDVLHVWHHPTYFGPEVVLHVPGHSQQTMGQFAQSMATQEMEKFLASLDHFGPVRGRGRLEAGDAYDGIMRVAKEGYDLIVMGTSGRGGIAHVLLGSVADKVVRHAPCAVLTVHAPGRRPAH